MQRTHAGKRPGLPVDPPRVHGPLPFMLLIQFPSWLCCVFHLNSPLEAMQMSFLTFTIPPGPDEEESRTQSQQ